MELGRRGKNATRTADQNQEEDAQSQVLQEVWRDSRARIAKTRLMPSGLHCVRCMGMPLTRLKTFRTTVGRCLPRKHARRSLTWMGRGGLGRAAGRCRSAQGLATAATTGGPEAVVEQGQWPDGCHHHVFEAIGMDMASPHDLRHCKRARGGDLR